MVVACEAAMGHDEVLHSFFLGLSSLSAFVSPWASASSGISLMSCARNLRHLGSEDVELYESIAWIIVLALCRRDAKFLFVHERGAR